MSHIRKGVILAGGYGRRLLPLTRATPKEMLPLGNQPILQHIVDEFKAAGLREILIVSREGKPAIADYFAGKRGIRVLTKGEALGPGHSVMFAREYLEGENFLVAFGDAPFGGEHANKLLPRLLRAHESLEAAAVLAIERVPESEVHLRAIIKTEGPPNPGTAARVTDLLQKPDPKEAPSDWAAAGRYTFSPIVFESLDVIASQTTGEILLADAIRHMLTREHPVYAMPLGKGEHRFDTGTTAGYEEALRAFTAD